MSGLAERLRIFCYLCYEILSGIHRQQVSGTKVLGNMFRLIGRKIAVLLVWAGLPTWLFGASAVAYAILALLALMALMFEMDTAVVFIMPLLELKHAE